MKVSRRVVVGVLGGCAATLASIVGAVSLTRIAGDYLGFPPGLEWTLTGAVDIAGIAGGIMWTAFAGPVRRIGRPMNIVCTVISGLGVGLDHATHAVPGPVWPWVAFAAGLFIPALAAWILHSLAVIADVVGVPAASGRQPAGSQAPVASQARPIASQPFVASVGDRQETAIVAKQPAARDRQPTPAPGRQLVDRPPAAERTAPQPARRPERPPTPVPARPARGLTAVPEPRLAWMTDDLITAVVKARRDDATYGRGQIVADHKIGSGQARTLLDYINKHGLLRDSA